MKPEAFQHRKVGRLSIPARWLWIGMLAHADDAGRLVADHGQLRLLIFGYDQDVTDTKVGQWLDEIIETGLVVGYQVDDVPLVYFPDWSEHQKIDRPSASKLPPPSPRKAPTKPSKRPHRATGRPRFGRPEAASQAQANSDAHIDSTNPQREVGEESASPHRDLGARSGSGSGSDQDLDLQHPQTPAASAASSVSPAPIEAEILNGNGHRPEPSKSKNLKRREQESPAFCAFMAEYPRPEYRKRAWEFWQARKLDAEADDVMAGLARWKLSASWAQRPLDKYPHPTTWLRGDCWKEFPAPTSGLSPKTEGNIAAGHRFIAKLQGGAR